MPALEGRPSLQDNYVCMVYWANGALFRNCWVFLFSRNSRVRFWGLVF